MIFCWFIITFHIFIGGLIINSLSYSHFASSLSLMQIVGGSYEWYEKCSIFAYIWLHVCLQRLHCAKFVLVTELLASSMRRFASWKAHEKQKSVGFHISVQHTISSFWSETKTWVPRSCQAEGPLKSRVCGDKRTNFHSVAAGMVCEVSVLHCQGEQH